MSSFTFINSKKLTDLIKILEKGIIYYFTNIITVFSNHLGTGIRTEEYV